MSLVAEHTRWHQQRLDALTAPDGWLTLVNLVWLDDGRQVIGSGPHATIALPDGPEVLGQLVVTGGRATWYPAEPAGNPQPLATDRDGSPTVIRSGRSSFFLIEREQGLGLRLRDEQAATRINFAGIDCFDFDPAWRLRAVWDGHRARFTHAGTEHSLRPQEPHAETLQFVLADATSGRETYGGGRFLFVPRPADDDLVLDFNRATNPPCAFTPFAVCPLPPAENRLPFAVTAGERTYRP